MIIGKYSAIKGFALFFLIIFFQVPCWNSFANTQSGFVGAISIIGAILSFVVVFLLYKYEKQLSIFFFSGKDDTPKKL